LSYISTNEFCLSDINMAYWAIATKWQPEHI